MTWYSTSELTPLSSPARSGRVGPSASSISQAQTWHTGCSQWRQLEQQSCVPGGSKQTWHTWAAGSTHLHWVSEPGSGQPRAKSAPGSTPWGATGLYSSARTRWQQSASGEGEWWHFAWAVLWEPFQWDRAASGSPDTNHHHMAISATQLRVCSVLESRYGDRRAELPGENEIIFYV